jgi:mono/diheme cytochrome c family protein
MKRLASVFAVLFLSASAFADDIVEFGRQIAETNCSGCHAVKATGASPHKDAPPFRELSSRYPLEALEEAFAEGIVVGHADMPVFRPTEDQTRALLAYLETIQSK